MTYPWKRIVIMAIALLALIIPRFNRVLLFRLVRNRMLRNVGLQIILTVPFLRERMLSKVLPSRNV